MWSTQKMSFIVRVGGWLWPLDVDDGIVWAYDLIVILHAFDGGGHFILGELLAGTLLVDVRAYAFSIVSDWVVLLRLEEVEQRCASNCFCLDREKNAIVYQNLSRCTVTCSLSRVIFVIIALNFTTVGPIVARVM